MRNAAWFGCSALSRFTGMLTSPKVSVPRQKARRATACSSSEARRSGTLTLRGREALLQQLHERALARAARRPGEADHLAARLGVHQVQDPLPVFVVEGAQVQVLHFHGADELPGNGDLAWLQRSSGRRGQARGRDDFAAMAQGD